MINRGFFPQASIYGCTVASNIKNTSNLWNSKFYPNQNSSYIVSYGCKISQKVLGTGRGGTFASIIVKMLKKIDPPYWANGTYYRFLFRIVQCQKDILFGINLEQHRLDAYLRFEAAVQLQMKAAGKILGLIYLWTKSFENSSGLDNFFELMTPSAHI